MDWRTRWQPLVDAVGTTADADGLAGADAVEHGGIRRFLEALEFDCPLHYDAETARAHGYLDVVAPVTSLMMFAIPALWCPGDDPIFAAPDRDALPPRTNGAPKTGVEPDVIGHVGTELELEFLAPVPVGSHLVRTPRQLVGCTLKETRLGRGAFTKWEMEIRDERDVTVARVRFGMYLYEPVGNDA